NKIGKLHTVLGKATSCCGCARVPPTPATRDTSIVSAPVPKKLLMMASIDDCSPSARDCTATLGNFVKATSDTFPRPTAVPPLMSGKRLCLPSLRIRNSLTILQRPTPVSTQRPQAPAVA
ncbi:unnamed protein product, partial [Gulo gulo]